MKRCENCGFTNESNALRCKECNYPLEGAGSSAPASASPVADQHSQENLSKTIPSKPSEMPAWDDDNNSKSGSPDNCPHCGYSLRPGVEICPNCNKNVNQTAEEKVNKKEKNAAGRITSDPFQKREPSFKGTIDPYAMDHASQPAFFLQPVSRSEKEETMKPLTFLIYEDKKVLLNRENTEPGNNTITGKVQAEIRFDNGTWWLENFSDHKTTYLLADRPLEISNGDVILMGNRKFVFKTEKQ